MFAYCREFEYYLRTRKGQTPSYHKNQTCLCMYVHFLFLEVETIPYIDIVYLFPPFSFFPLFVVVLKSFFYTTSLWKYWACYIHFLCFGAFILLCFVKSSNQACSVSPCVFSLCCTVPPLGQFQVWHWMVSAWWVLEFWISSLKLISSATLVVLPHQSTMSLWLKYQTLILTIWDQVWFGSHPWRL